MAKVGVREVAARAGVSTGTVSNYLNSPSNVSPDKRARIRDAIVALGYVRNQASIQLSQGRSSLVAYLAPEIASPSFAAIHSAAQLRGAHERLSVFAAPTHGDREVEEAYLTSFEENRLHGLLVNSRREIEDRLLEIWRRGTPSVLIGQSARSQHIPSVRSDDARGGELVAAHLLETGYRRIAFVGGPFSVPSVAKRFEGVAKVVKQSGTAVVEVIDVVRRSMQEGREVARLLACRSPGTRPDAVFCVNDLLALGAMQVLVRELGLSVPRDIALVGYDDTEFAGASLIPLTSVRQSHEELGTTAMELLLEAVERLKGVASGELSVPPARHVTFEPELKVRESSLSA